MSFPPPRLPFSFQAHPFSEIGLFRPPSAAPSIFPVAGRIVLPSFCDPPRLACAPGIACQNLRFSASGLVSLVHAVGRPYLSTIGVPPLAVQFLSRLGGTVYPSLVATSPSLPLCCETSSTSAESAEKAEDRSVGADR